MPPQDLHPFLGSWKLVSTNAPKYDVLLEMLTFHSSGLVEWTVQTSTNPTPPIRLRVELSDEPQTLLVFNEKGLKPLWRWKLEPQGDYLEIFVISDLRPVVHRSLFQRV